VLLRALAFLAAPDLTAVACCCRALRELSGEEVLWRRLYCARWGRQRSNSSTRRWKVRRARRRRCRAAGWVAAAVAQGPWPGPWPSCLLRCAALLRCALSPAAAAAPRQELYMLRDGEEMEAARHAAPEGMEDIYVQVGGAAGCGGGSGGVVGMWAARLQGRRAGLLGGPRLQSRDGAAAMHCWPSAPELACR
jgi:hypothetical protein